ncbi:MAG: C1 family peptidase [Aureispira sp.]
MAIRFRPDEQPSNNNNPRGGGNRGGGNNSRVIMAVLLFAFRYPKIGIPLVVIGGLVYFFMGGFSGNSPAPQNQEQRYSMGGNIDPDRYKQYKVFAALSSASPKYNLPKSVSLRPFAPTPRNQGQQGSCVGWASAYAARTILEAVRTDQDPNQLAYSPSFLYNQIGVPNCQGAFTGEALEHMKTKGLLEFSKFSYNPNSCSKKPTSQELRSALGHRIKGYNRLTKTGRNYDVDLEAVKQNIAQGAPVVIAAKVPNSFQNMMGKKLWRPTNAERGRVDKLGGHAMCLIGYDDNQGVFEIQNSWGTAWGDNGFVFVKYEDFKIFCREAYGIFPEQRASTKAATEIAIECGIYSPDRKSGFELRQIRGNLFETTSPIKKGTPFKVEITNSLECFTYVFSKEVDKGGRQGAAIKVFPPSNQYSAYLGIVGTRLFPREGVLEADNEGNRDYMAIVYSKKELNPDQIRQRIDQAGQGDFYANVMAALGNRAFGNLSYTKKSGNSIAFRQSISATQDIAVVVIAMDKQ